MSSHAGFPDDIAALKALIAERDAALAQKEVFVTELREQLSTRAAESEQKLWIAKVGNLHAIADGHHDHMMVFVSENGNVYFFTDSDEKLYFGGRSFGQSMERLLLGIEYGPAIEP